VWVTSIDQRRVTRIDPRSNAVNGSFHVGHGPSGVALALHRLWVLDNTDSTVSALDPQSGRTLATVTVGPHSYDMAAGGSAVRAQSYADHALYKIQPAAPTRNELTRRYTASHASAVVDGCYTNPVPALAAATNSRRTCRLPAPDPPSGPVPHQPVGFWTGRHLLV
jgi:DNA-binding beta-propeller fold protein YncE